MHNSILQISNEITCIGTGFVISSDAEGAYVVTCGHVVNDCNGCFYVGGKSAELIQNMYEGGLDLAVLYVKSLNFPALKISKNNKPEQVDVIGFSILGGDSKREPINNIDTKYGIQIKEIDAIKLYPKEPISYGYSGAPVICSSSKEVVGVVNIQVGEGINYAITAKHLFEFNGLQIQESKNEPVVGSTIKKDQLTVLDPTSYALLKNKLDKTFSDSLLSYTTQPVVWVEPILHSIAEDFSDASEEDSKLTVAEVIERPANLVIQARQQYGLSALSHCFVSRAWSVGSPSFWLHINAYELKPYAKEIGKHVTAELKEIDLVFDDIKCVVLDGFSSKLKNANKLLVALTEYFSGIPLIVMLTIDENPLLEGAIKLPKNKSFRTLYLWALARNGVRDIVNKYNNNTYIDDENKIVTKITSDLEVLNIPRTPLNCITLLKISEVKFDDDPVNRTDMIKRVLYLLFNVDEIPKYKTRPDVKDTEFVLGYFCETLLRQNSFNFTRHHFISVLNQFCNDREIDLSIDIIFDVLYANNILILRGEMFAFKFSYWVFYFAAHRMHHNEDFLDFIFHDMNYASYPEVIEFYTGIDRKRDNALIILIKDVNSIRNKVDAKCGLPSSFSVYDHAKWVPSNEQIDDMRNEVVDGVLSSNLPDVIKDQYADRSYDKVRPLNQSIHTILGEYSLLKLMRGVKAGAQALRNSDYASPILRHELLDIILKSWEQISRVILALSPILATEKVASVDGASFHLSGDFGENTDEILNAIFALIPTNIVHWYRDDLFSKKMSTLLHNHMAAESNDLIKHMLCLLIVNKRPEGWHVYVEKYIVSKHKNSFYLNDLYRTLKAEYKYSFVSNLTLIKIEFLIKKAGAKHELGIKNPNKTLIGKLNSDNLPKRENNGD